MSLEYSKFSVKELKTILDKKGVKGCSKYRKDELINILSKLENIEDEENDENKEELEIPLPPKIEGYEEELENNNSEENEDIQNNEIEIEEDEKKEEIEIEEDEAKKEIQNKEDEIKVNEENLKDSVRLFENFKPTLAISGDKKSEILKGMIQYKTAQKMMERQEIQNEINKVLAEARVMRQEYLSIIENVKKDLKEVRESFLMANLIILHNFSFLPLDKLPIFKNQKK
jgi:hypothetical protein